jgi:hypothetical protein
MTNRAMRVATALLALLVTAAAPAPTRVGFVNVPQLVTTHPLYVVLREYDRELAALRSTQNMGDVASEAAGAAQSVRRDAAIAQQHAQQQPDEAREQRAIAGLLASQRGGDRGVNAFAGELARATNASLSAYRDAMMQRNARAYAARAQELRERELTLAFDLARANAGKRLSLRLKLQELHLTRTARAQIASQLGALDASEQRTVAVMQRADAVVLAAYRGQLVREATAAIDAMNEQLRAKAAANFATRRGVAQVAGSSAGALTGLPTQAAAFRANAHDVSGAAAIRAGFKAAGEELSPRFEGLASVGATSAHATESEIRRLEATRAALYSAIVAEIARDAESAARKRNLAGVRLTGKAPASSVDLTAAVRRELNSARR